MDIALEVVPNAMYLLHALTPGDLEQWSPQELYEWADEAQRSLAHRHGLYCTRLPYGELTSLAYDANQYLVALPADHLDSVEVEANGLRLLPANTVEMQAYADDWDEQTALAPTRYVGDGFRTGTLTLYPRPTQPGTLALVYQRDGVPFQPGSSIELQLNALWGDALTLAMVSKARAIETDAQMPEVVQFAAALYALYDAAAAQYYSGGF